MFKVLDTRSRRQDRFSGREDKLVSFREHLDLRAAIEAWIARPAKRIGTTDIPELHAVIATTVGEVRSENQDRAVIARLIDPRTPERSFLAYVLCDGMGGMVDGSHCAEIAIATFIQSFVTSPSPASIEGMENAVLQANGAVFQRYRGRGGTTLTALVLVGHGEARAITVGDTRLYEFSRSEKIRQVSTDDTIAAELKRLKRVVTESQLEPFSNRLAQFVGMGDGLEPRTHTINRQGMDSSFLLSTDGTRVIDEVTFERVVNAAPSLQAIANRLIHLSNWCGGADNSSVICVAGGAANSLRHLGELRDPVLEIWDCFAKLAIVNFPGPENASQLNVSPKPSIEEAYRSTMRVKLATDTQSRANKTSKSRKHKKTESDAKFAPTTNHPRQKQFEIAIVESPAEQKPDLKTERSESDADTPDSSHNDPPGASESHSNPK
jgi:PPM family protein phosphatase